MVSVGGLVSEMVNLSEFEKWWSRYESFIDPDFSEIPWLDIRKALCEDVWDAAIKIGMARAGNYAANTETEPTSLVFANGTKVSVVNGHLVIDRCLTPAGREILKQTEGK